ncbi:hypothetical protein Ddye_021027 [Dipteronia dyeriana]|uniref:Uncharacterized protein n=1 Tax=Dipteronia dyeriana TaxID=168575 RepID=A0AAD9U106_9ROSI|nr:hypothetical protein Ddye_021027 [Dipteronia dyeriana]
MIFVPLDLTYHGLMNTIEDSVRIDSSTFNIELKAVMTTSWRRAIPRIKNDRDVAFLMSEERVIPEVYVTTVERYEWAGGSMQTETEMQAQIPPNIVLQQGFQLLSQPHQYCQPFQYSYSQSIQLPNGQPYFETYGQPSQLHTQ